MLTKLLWSIWKALDTSFLLECKYVIFLKCHFWKHRTEEQYLSVFWRTEFKTNWTYQLNSYLSILDQNVMCIYMMVFRYLQSIKLLSIHVVDQFNIWFYVHFVDPSPNSHLNIFLWLIFGLKKKKRPRKILTILRVTEKINDQKRTLK